MKSMKLSQYFELKNPKYVALQLIPSTSNRNYDTELIAQTIANITPEPIAKRFKRQIKPFKLTYEIPQKISFVTKICSDDVFFYLIAPDLLKPLFISKCQEVWKRVTIKECKVPQLGVELQYALQYAQEDAMSLKFNKKTNDPLNNIMMVKSILQGNDYIDIAANFIPIMQSRWKGIYKTTMDKLKKDMPVDKDKTKPSYLLQIGISYFFIICDAAFEMVESLISSSKSEKKHNDKQIQLTQFTTKKEGATILQAQIVLASNSKTYIQNVTDSFKVIKGDNYFESKLIKNNLNDIEKYSWNTPQNLMSTAECNNLIQLPGRELLESMKIKTKVDVLENPVPDELISGNILLGNVTYKDKTIQSYLPIDYNYANLALVALGPQGSGKTNFFANFAKNASKSNESNVFIDFVKNCELSEAVKSVVDQGKIIDIDLSKRENFQAFAFNEIYYSGSDEFHNFEVASLKAEMTLAFVDAINDQGLPLTGNMRRMLSAAANITFLQHNTSIGINK